MSENENPTSVPPADPTPPRLARRLSDSSPSNRNRILYGLIGVLVIAGLLLPPVSLFERVFKPCGELAIGADSASAQQPDGLTVLQASPEQSYRLTLSAASRADFEAGAAGEDMAAARDALPVNLMLNSPVYRIAVCGDPQPGALRVAIPADASPVSTLDLYAWNGEGQTWSWIGSSKNAADNTIAASVDALPEALALMQTTSAAPAIGAEAGPGDALAGDIAEVVTEMYPSGLVIAADGSLGGDRSGLPAASDAAWAVYPVVRNYLTRGQPNPDLVRGVLGAPETREAHLQALVALADDDNLAGVTIDYQGLTADDRDAFTAFVSDLAAALRAQGKRLNVVLPQPSFAADGQADSAGYDWLRIGLAADVVQSPLEDDALLSWATAQVDRYKLQPIVSAASVETTNGINVPISFQQAIGRLGVVSTTAPLSITAESAVTFTLQSDVAIGSFAFDAAAGVYTYEFTDKANTAHQVTIGTAAALAKDLAVILPHYTRGVVIRGAAGESAPGLADALRAYRQQSAAKIAPEIEVVWAIRRGGASASTTSRPLTQSWLNWRAPADAGTYRVSASLAGMDLGQLDVAVNEAAPEEEVLAVTAGLGSGAGGLNTDGTPAGASAAACYNAVYVADVSVPDGTHFDKGEEFTKTWQVRNTGTCAWNADTEIAFVSGSQLGAPSTTKVGPLETGKDVEISVPMKSGDADGNFTGVWQLRNEDGFYGQTLTVVIATGQPPAAAAPAPGAGPVAPIGNIGSFEVGGHIDSFRRPDLMLYAGLKWIKIQTFAGTDMSGAINNAHAQGFKILLGVLGDKGRVMDPGYQSEYAASVAAMAAAGADAIEVWNEPNINREWPTGQISGANYTALLAKAYPAIKAANPGTLVISGAPAPTGFWGAAGCSPDGCNDDAFLAQMAAAGAANYMDCVGAHHNSGTTSPSVSSGRPEGNHYSWYFLPTLNLYYNAFGGARKVCFTELGYLSGEGYPDLASTAPAFAWARNTTVAQQAQWLAEAASMSARSGKVRLMIIWNIDFTRYDSDPMAGYAIIRPGDSCPACDALRNVLGGR